MHAWLNAHFPPLMADILLSLWYALLLLLLAYCWDRPAAAFLYLHR